MSETEDWKTLEWAVGLLQHPNGDVALEALVIVQLYHEGAHTGSTVARCSIAQGIGETEKRIRKLLAGVEPTP